MKAWVGTFTYEQWKKQCSPSPDSIKAFKEAMGEEKLEEIWNKIKGETK